MGSPGLSRTPAEVARETPESVVRSGRRGIYQAMKTDTQLLQAYVDRGDRGAFDALVARHYGHVQHVALRLVHNEFDARDIAQNVFVRALRHADQVRDPTRFRAWLLRITVNEVRQQRRRPKPPAPVDHLQLAFEDVHGPSVEKEANRREFELELEMALERMPEHLKVPLVLHYYQSLSLAEVAAILEMPKSTVQHRVEKAVHHLRRRFRTRDPAVLLPLLAARFPSSPAATASLSSGLVTGGAFAVKTYLALAAALLLVLFAATRLLGLFEGAEDVPRIEATDPIAGLQGGTAEGHKASLRGRAAASEDRAAPPVVPGRLAIHSAGPGRIVGRVITLAGGRGVAGVRVILTLSSATDEDLGFTPFENRYVSGPDGAFVCDHLPLEGVYALVFHHPDHAYAELPIVAFRSAQTEADVGAVLLDRAVALEGIVVDAAGAPLSGVAICAGNVRRGPRPVIFDHREGRLNGARATSGKDGRFRLTELAAAYHHIQASKPGYASIGLGSVHVGNGPSTPLKLTLRASRPIDGIVVDRRGRPIPGASVEVGLRESVHTGTQGYTRGFPWAQLRTDDEGRFRIDEFPDTTGVGVALDVHHPEHASFYETYDKRPYGSLRVTLTRRPTPKGVPVVVRVLNGEGRALEGVPGTALLSLDSDEFDLNTTVAVDERTGEADFTQVPSGSHYLHVEMLGCRPRGEAIAVGDAPRVIPFRLERGALAVGRVVDVVTGDPVPGAVVATSEVNRVVTDADGRFRLRGLSGGVRLIGAVTVAAEGYLDACPQLPFQEGQGRVEIEVPLWPVTALRTVAGQVVDTQGRPVAGASLDIELATPTIYRVPARTATDGRFAFRALDPTHLRSHMQIRITHPAYARQDAWVTPADLECALHLILERGRRVSGRVLDEADRPIAGVSVGAVSTDEFGLLEGRALEGHSLNVDSIAGRLGPRFAATARTDANGGFVLDPVPTDALQIFAFGAQTRWLVEDGQTGARVASGAAEATDVVIHAVRGWTVRGRVEDPQGRGLPGLWVRVPELRVGTSTSADGSFTVSPVFGDTAVLEVEGPDHVARAEVTPSTGVGLRIVATTCGGVTGHVVDVLGKGIAGVRVRLRVAEFDLVRWADTDEEGRFVLGTVPVGARSLEIDGTPPRDIEVLLGIETDVGRITR